MTMTSPSMDLSELSDYAENLISPTLSTIDGVAQVIVYGEKRYAVRVQVNPSLLATKNLTIDDVASAINAANSNTPVGVLDGPRQQLTIYANPQIVRASDYGNLVISQKSGLPIRLKDVANVQESYESVKTLAAYNGERSIAIAILRQPTANSVSVVDSIRKMVPQFQQQMPASVEINLLIDRSASIRESIHDVNFTLLLTIGLVVMVIFLFLKHLAATIIPALSLPISLIGAFSIMYWMGYSLDNVSLLGITIAVGLVVDDAIVVLENIMRHIENGMAPLKAALKGSREVSFTIVSISISLVAVFIPIFFMPGPIGLLFREFAVVVSLSILVSAVMSLTLVPMLCSKFLKTHNANAKVHDYPIIVKFDQYFNLATSYYEQGLDWALANQKKVLQGAIATFVITIALFVWSPKGFFPEEDIGQLFITTEAAEDISFAGMLELQDQAAAIVRANPNIDSLVSILGGGASTGSNTGRMFINLKPRSDRKSMKNVLESLRKDLSVIPGLAVYMRPIQNLQLGGKVTKSRYQYILQSVGFEGVNEWSNKVVEKMRADPVFRDVTTDSQLKGLQAQLNIDRDKAASAGVTIANIRNALYSAYGERQVSTIYTSVNTYQVILEAGAEYKRFESDINNIYVRGRNSDRLVPLSSIATVTRTVGPTAVNHQGQVPAVTISFNLAPDAALGDATKKLEQFVKDIQLPATIITSYGGDAAVFQSGQSSQVILLLGAVLVIYVLLGILYESYIHPITILAGLPSAAIGALVFLRIFNLELTIIAIIGILLLIGIVKKNAILMIDFALDVQRHQNKSPQEAIRAACLMRFRPIMMTTMAALMGALPIALGLGAGAELRQPLGVAVVGGLLVSQVVTLLITPVIYLYLDKYSGTGPMDIPAEMLKD
jgi:HAE1 family hydrophobic/amphiphilic exporter-1